MTLTYQSFYRKIRDQFRQAEISSPELEARELLCFATGKSREDFIRDSSQMISSDIKTRVQNLVDKRLAGMPLAYLIGEWEFFGLPLEISQDVLIPRTDTEILAEEAIRYLKTLKALKPLEKSKTERILDLCAGSGCIGLAIAANMIYNNYYNNIHVVLAEISEPALQICRRNIQRCGLENRVTAYPVDVRETPDLLLLGGPFQCIVSNPPYIASQDIADLDISVRDYEPHLALDGGPDGLDFYRVIAQKWQIALVPGGRIFLEVGIYQANHVKKILEEQGFRDIQMVRDTGGILRVISGTRAS